MRPGYRHLYLIGALLNFTALVLIFLYGIPTVVALVLLAASLIILGTLILQRKQFEEETRPDERTKKIGAEALSYAWWIGIVGIIMLFWADALGIWRLGSLITLGISFLLLLGPAVIFLVYLSTRGDTGE